MSAVLGNIRYWSYYNSINELKADPYAKDGKVVCVRDQTYGVNYVRYYRISSTIYLESYIRLNNGLYAIPILIDNMPFGIRTKVISVKTDSKGCCLIGLTGVLSATTVTVKKTATTLDMDYKTTTSSENITFYPTVFCSGNNWYLRYANGETPLADTTINITVYYIG